jgi:aromatic ring-opening dioxygenase catalytic subunit (LigB family)
MSTTSLPSVFVPHGAGPAFFMPGPLAAAVAEHLHQADIKAVLDPGRGRDRGVFIPLKVMYPAADIPVVAMSLQAGLDPQVHAAIGAALRPLREAGVLIVGSGMSYHNMSQPDGALASSEFHQWLDGALSGDAGQRQSAWPAGRRPRPRVSRTRARST